MRMAYIFDMTGRSRTLLNAWEVFVTGQYVESILTFVIKMKRNPKYIYRKPEIIFKKAAFRPSLIYEERMKIQNSRM